jgi:hypothetical protein
VLFVLIPLQAVPVTGCGLRVFLEAVMVAMSVGGVAVTHIRQARTDKVAFSVFEDPDKVSTIRGVAELTLADGSHTFACTSCEYANDSLRGVVSHMGGKHPGESVRAPGEGRSIVAAGITLRDAIRAVNEKARAEAKAALWQRRALVAERELKTLKRSREPR